MRNCKYLICFHSITHFLKGSMERKCKQIIQRNDFLLNDALSYNKISQSNSVQDQTNIWRKWDPFKPGASELCRFLSCTVYMSLQSILHLPNYFCRTVKYFLLKCTSTIKGVKTKKKWQKIAHIWVKSIQKANEWNEIKLSSVSLHCQSNEHLIILIFLTFGGYFACFLTF